MKNIYDVETGDVYWAASDIGWVVGHSYIVYAPLISGCTSVLFEGKPIGTPDAGTFWRIISEYKVKVLFTAPTALRAVKRDDPNGDFIKKWVPELKELEYPFYHEPWKMTTLEQAMNQFFLDENYPQPIIDLKTSRLNASSVLWGLRKEKAVREDAIRIKAKHINNPNSGNR